MPVTLADLTTRHGLQVLQHLNAAAEVPILDGIQAQGDLFIIPLTETGRTTAGLTALPVPTSGIPVIPASGDAAHEHRLFAGAPGTATWAPIHDGQDIGILECTEPAYILHAEHGATGVATGTYLLRRQREQAKEERLVID
ncbi:MAG TPA: hypothetical protein VKV80_15055 [Streptosporangiaceae bacterium]|jgi:hypothetical protein|nr:hypothetical protein [Streptosporangiaceae bacterium]